MTTAVVYGTCEVMKPALPQEPLSGETPPAEAYKEGRKIYRGGKWHDAVILEMEKLLPGNVITGPAVIEAGATTFVVPPATQARLDQHRIFHLRHLDA
jgi:N-methylhydantoinase A/oxoprolinase/acetone carboxylase beta subunit